MTKSPAKEKFLLLGWKSARTFASAGRFFAARTKFFRAESVTGYFRRRARKISGVNRTNDG